jgi:FtsZ-interacting cell division protein ZipA
MSELQTALLAIGLGAIVAVYAFGWWQQRRYQRKFGTTFKSTQADALYQGSYTKSAEPMPQTESEETVADEHFLPEEVVVATPASDESCAALDGRSDFIVELHLREASPASVLENLWQRKFDFGKTVQVCGLTLGTKQWERAIAEAQTLYSDFRVALQLVDRSGLISSAKLADFRDLVTGIAHDLNAEATVPDVQETTHRALQLDAFCVVVDQMIGINLMPAGSRLLSGMKIYQAAAVHGMTLESDGAFHLLNAQGHSLFSLINRDTKAFQPHTLERFTTAGMTLLLDVPRVVNPAQQFDQMMLVAHELAKELQVNLVDDRRIELTEAVLAPIRAKVSEVELKMREQDIIPGSTQARRLFS